MSVESVQVTPQNVSDPNKVVAGIAPNLNVKLKLTGFIFPTDGQTAPLAPALPSAVHGSLAPPTPPAPAPRAAAPSTSAALVSPGPCAALVSL